MTKICWAALAALLLFSCKTDASDGDEPFRSDNPKVDEAYRLAMMTVRYNVRDGILAAGADYGGEWTRDIAINTWNGIDLFLPGVAQKSLWGVTLDRKSVGHQYWDKIIWVQGAFVHYLLTRDEAFLREAYACSLRTMRELENEAFDTEYGLFTGSSVFNDGISAFEEPIYDPAKAHLSGVLKHNTKGIKCLSTNCVYYMAYCVLGRMHRLVGDGADPGFDAKADALREAIRRHFFNPRGKMYYAIDQEGSVHPHQEALGIAFAILSGVVTPLEGHFTLIRNETSPWGVPSITPVFKRFSLERPGRHNRLIWPFVNAFYANAALVTGDEAIFDHELYAMASLALDEDKGNYNFYEIFDPETGKPEGGNQAGRDRWHSRRHQTWSATGYLAMIHYGICGLRPTERGLELRPYLPEGLGEVSVKGLRYGKMTLDVSLRGRGGKIRELRINGKPTDECFLPADLSGPQRIEAVLEKPRFP